MSDSKNIDFKVRSVSLEVRSDAVLGVVLWWVWFCMSLNTRPALWKPMWFARKMERKKEKHDFLVNLRIFVKAITLWQYFDSAKNKKSWKSVSTLSRAHQNQSFLGLFQDLARVVRPKWWFLFFEEKTFLHCLELA